MRDSPSRVRRHSVGQIHSGPHGEQPHVVVDAHETHRFPGRAEAAFNLGTDRHPLHERAERLRQKRVTLMAAVEPDGLAQKA